MKLGQLKKLQTDITAPIPMKFDIDYNMLNIFIGQNGTGKSFMLKLVWAAGTIMAQIIFNSLHRRTANNELLAQVVLDQTFESNDIDGEIAFQYENGLLVIKLMKGQVDSVRCTLPLNVEQTGIPLFMSTSMRMFTQIRSYLVMRSMIGAGEILNDADMGKLVKAYRLYDITYAERLIVALKRMTDTQTEEINKSMKGFDDGFDLINITILPDLSDIVYSGDGHFNRSTSLLGNGHQALLNIMVATHLLQ